MIVVAGIIGLVIGLGALVGLIFMLLWNWIMPYLFGLPSISFWMAWGITILLGFLFNGVRATTKK